MGEVETMPYHLERFRPIDWMDGAGIDVESDLWEALPRYTRPRTQDPAVLDAFERFEAARRQWEQAHPEWSRQQVAMMVRRRLRRQELGGLVNLPPEDY